MTVHIAKVVTLPDNLQGLTNLAGAHIGASIVSCSDEFFCKCGTNATTRTCKIY